MILKLSYRDSHTVQHAIMESYSNCKHSISDLYTLKLEMLILWGYTGILCRLRAQVAEYIY